MLITFSWNAWLKTRFHHPAYGLGNMTMCHRTNCAPSGLVFMLNRRSEKLKPYVILNPEEHCVQEGKTSAQQQLLKLLNKTGSTGVSPPFHTQRCQHSCLAIALLHLYLCPRNWIFLEWYMNEARLLMWLYQTYQQSVPINQPPILWKCKKTKHWGHGSAGPAYQSFASLYSFPQTPLLTHFGYLLDRL